MSKTLDNVLEAWSGHSGHISVVADVWQRIKAENVATEREYATRLQSLEAENARLRKAITEIEGTARRSGDGDWVVEIARNALKED